ncbi:killer cell lectin-like receptor subfamily B member 1C [Eleutherodactylus coqui]|uniref:killer cell lectin-like receptor subfamily B member 1C n=1 Tax=Eleutherodactylus coqui TaxID=57060 RepID=UPI0034635397
MEQVIYCKVKVKKNHGLPPKIDSAEEDGLTSLYADIRTGASQCPLPVDDQVPVYHHIDNEKCRSLDRHLLNLHQELCLNKTDGSLGCHLCPLKWLLQGDDCYYYSDVTSRTWNQSQAHCRMMGADLLGIKDQEQQEFIKRTLKQRGEETYWIGLYRDGDDWRWVDGEHFNSSLFQIETQSSGRCISMITGSGYYQRDCESVNKWICVKKAVRI